MLIDEIKKANIQAMKDHDAVTRGVLAIIMTKYKLIEVEGRANGKEVGDAELLSIIQKTIKELSDEKEGYIKANNQERVDMINKQEAIVKAYLPKQLSEDDIRNEISKLSDKSLPSIMKHFKTNFAGQVDMSLVSQIARNI